MQPRPRRELPRLWWDAMGEMLPVAIAVATIVGLSEVGITAWRWFVDDRLAGWNRFLPWMVPLGYAAILIVGAVGCAALRAVSSGRVPSSFFTFCATTLGLSGVLHLATSGRIYAFTVLSVAAAIGWQVARADGRNGGVRTFSRRAAPWLAAGIGLLAAASIAREWRTGREALASSAPAAGAPNVLLIAWDTVRRLPLVDQGYDSLPTPHLRRLARQGAEFTNAWSTAPWTLPAHASLLTGRYPSELRADWLSPLEPSVPTLAEAFRDGGYRTGAFVANLYYTVRETGLDRGFDVYRDQEIGWRQVMLSAEVVQWIRGWESSRGIRAAVRKPAPRVSAEFLRWASRQSDRPFFALLNFFDAHIPYYAPPELRARFNGGTMGDRYMASVAYLDAQLGELLASLDQAGLLQNTVVVVTSDHGEQFGRHGLFDHGNSLYHQVLGVPLVVAAPGRVPAGSQVAEPVSLRDVPATLLDLAGVSGHGLPGRSLAGFWSEPGGFTASEVRALVTKAPNAPAKHRNADGPVRALVQGRYHYILDSDKREELFDVLVDPFERFNLATELPDVADSMRAGLLRDAR